MISKATAQRPSDIIGVQDRWAAYQFDSAVTLVGGAIENAVQEMQEIGEGQHRRLVPKYSLEQLLDPDFRLPPPPSAKDKERDGLAALHALAGRPGSGVRVFKAKDKAKD